MDACNTMLWGTALILQLVCYIYHRETDASHSKFGFHSRNLDENLLESDGREGP